MIRFGQKVVALVEKSALARWRVTRWPLMAAWQASVRLRIILGIPIRLDGDDRHVLENIIIPELVANFRLQRVLFVGCDYYTKHYEGLFPPNVEYQTIEIDPSRVHFGARLHIVDGMENAERHWQQQSFDLIVCNGVFGWGLDKHETVEQAIRASFNLLRDGGLFVFGWNDIDPYRPVPLAEIQALKQFEEYTFAPLGTWRYLCRDELRHTFDFYVRPSAEK